MPVGNFEKKNIAVLALKNSTLATAIGAMEIFFKCNFALKSVFGLNEDIFSVEIISYDGEPVRAANNITINCQKAIGEAGFYDLIVIPGIEFDFIQNISLNSAYLSWLVERYDQGSEIASLCTGAFFLAETGLLDGKYASTHWAASEEFVSSYPKVNYLSDKILVDNGNIYTSGGASTFINLIIYIIEKYLGAEAAHITAKMLLIDLDKGPQKQYAIFTPQKKHDDYRILNAQIFIEDNFRNKLTIEQIADSVALAPRSFIRRFKKATGNTPHEYIQRVKVEAVKKMLETTNKSVQEAIFEVGYEDVGAFRKVFKKLTGVTPNDYKAKYSHLENIAKVIYKKEKISIAG